MMSIFDIPSMFAVIMKAKSINISNHNPLDTAKTPLNKSKISLFYLTSYYDAICYFSQ